MLRRLLAEATASTTSSLSRRRVSNHVVPVLFGVNHPSTARSSSPGLSTSIAHPTSGLSSLGSLLKFSAIGSQTASISGGISANDVDRSAGEGEGGIGCDGFRASGCLDPDEAEGLSPKDPSDSEDLSVRIPRKLRACPSDLEDLSSVLNAAKAEDVSPEDVEKLVYRLASALDLNYEGAMNTLELSGLRLSPGSVTMVLSRLAENYDAALAFFLWAVKQPDNQLSHREIDSMIRTLMKRRRYEDVMSLIREAARSDPSLVTRQCVLYLLKKFCARGQVENAISIFDSLEELGCEAGIAKFESLLSYLCRYGKVTEAEKFLRHDEKRFPLCTKSFNIVLRGWCEVLVSPPKAKRFWLAMKDIGLQHDAESYGTMISCLTSVKDVDAVLKLFGEMKGMGIDPDMKVYKGVLTALVKTNRVKEAMDVIKEMEEERGMFLGKSTFNSLFWWACRCGSAEGVVELLNRMTKNGVRLSTRSLRVPKHWIEKPLNGIFTELRTGEDIVAVLGALTGAKFCLPVHTYNILVRKLCMLQDYGGLFIVWSKMCSEGPEPDRKTYISIIYGLSLNRKMEEARKYYLEMRTQGFNPDARADLGFLIKKMKRP